MNLNELPKNHKRAKELNNVLYFTGKPCSRGHFSARRTSKRVCVECEKEYYQINKCKIKKRSAERYDNLNKNDPDFQEKRYASTIESQKIYRNKNRDKRRTQCLGWRLKNRNHVLEYAKKYNSNIDENKKRKQGRENYQRNKETFIANVALRRASKSKRTPEWLTETDKNIIRNVYKEASGISKETGIKHHVDHILPLRGETVSGLHVPSNLQILTANANILKRNKFQKKIF